jgi:hypothetical protein
VISSDVVYTELMTPTGSVEGPPGGTLSFAGKVFTLNTFFNTTSLDNYVFPQPVTFTIHYEPGTAINNLPPRHARSLHRN